MCSVGFETVEMTALGSEEESEGVAADVFLEVSGGGSGFSYVSMNLWN
jgi:hypothetical protein